MNIGRLFGIAIRIDPSWLFVFALAVWSLSDAVGPFGSAHVPADLRVLLAVGTALLFFVSILAHELAHSLVARSRGIPIKQITLFIFGGISAFEGEPTTAPSAAWIALVGPLASLAIGAGFWFVSAALGAHTPFGVAAMYLSFANVVIGAFNLIPAFPLDGGRVLHAILWSVFKDRVRATKAAVGIGRALAFVIIGFGIWETLAFGFGNGLWLTFVGWFLLQAGQAEAFQTDMSVALKGHEARELVEPAGSFVPANSTAAQVVAQFKAQRAGALPVMLGDQLLGVITVADLDDAKPEELENTYVTALMTRRDDLQSITPQTSASDVLRLLGKSGEQQVAVIDPDGTFLGFITARGLLRWVAFDRDQRLAQVSAKH